MNKFLAILMAIILSGCVKTTPRADLPAGSFKKAPTGLNRTVQPITNTGDTLKQVSMSKKDVKFQEPFEGADEMVTNQIVIKEVLDVPTFNTTYCSNSTVVQAIIVIAKEVSLQCHFNDGVSHTTMYSVTSPWRQIGDTYPKVVSTSLQSKDGGSEVLLKVTYTIYGKISIVQIGQRVFYRDKPLNKKVGVRYHTVKRGENLVLIAKKYGTTVSSLTIKNKIDGRAILKPGKVIQVN